MTEAIFVAVLAVVAAFTVINGINDGGTLVVMGLKIPLLKPQMAIGLLVTTLAIGPVLFGTRVATTLATRLVSFEGDGGQVMLLIAIAAASGVALTLAHHGLPTSLTLALIGAIAGAGLGAGLPVAWGMVVQVLIMAALAPVVGALLAFALMRVISRAPIRTSTSRTLSSLHALAFALQCIGYAANDGQKMLALFAVALGTVSSTVAPTFPIMLAIAVCFGIGTTIGLPRMSKSIGGGIIAVRPLHAVAAEFASAGAVLGSAALAAPVSMTQAIAGGLAGTGISEGAQRVRWRAATRIALAWVITLPSAASLAALLGTVGRVRW